MNAALRFVCILICLSLGAAGCAHHASAPASSSSVSTLDDAEAALANVGLSVRELRSDVFLAVQSAPGGAAANILFVRMRDGTVVFCSSPYDTEATRALVRYVRARFGAGRMIAINTHFHADGTGGNEGYAAEGVETYASDHTDRLQVERGAAGLEGMARYVDAEAPALAARIRATHFSRAQQLFPEPSGLTLSFGDESLRVVFVGGAHSADNVVVHFPERGVLFGGCMVRAHPGLGNTADADLEHWSVTAEAALAFEASIVIPGHGEPGGKELLISTAAAARLP